ncbi:MAG: hypothetical protein ACR2K4_05405 [Candidatus Limnocylindria bacterium]
MDTVCRWADDAEYWPGDPALLINRVLVGETGVSALEDAWDELDFPESADDHVEFRQAADPICDAIGWPGG